MEEERISLDDTPRILKVIINDAKDIADIFEISLEAALAAMNRIELLKIHGHIDEFVEDAEVIEEENDSEEELSQIAEFIASVNSEIPWHLSRFHPVYKMRDKKVTSYQALKHAYKIGKKYGLKYVYIGNVPEQEYQQTYCPQCGKVLIHRVGYEVEYKMKNAKCQKCGEAIAGVW